MSRATKVAKICAIFVKKHVSVGVMAPMKHAIASLGLVLTVFASVTSGATFNPVAEAREIDSILAKDWKANGLKQNAAADDNTMVRRLYLDIVGRIPTAREAEAFLSDGSPDKKAKLIERLLRSEGQALHAFNYWADVLRAQTNGQARIIAGTAYTEYLKDSLRENKPYDQLVRELVSAQGQAWDNGAIGYYMRDRGMPLDNLANTARVFLGTRIECAQCHDHPFDKWTQMQFFQMGAFTYGLDTNDYYGASMNDMREIVRDRESDARAMMKSKDKKEQAKGKELYEKYRKEGQYVTRAMADLRNQIQYTQVTLKDKDLRLPHDYQYDDAKPKSVVAPATMMGHKAEPRPGETQLDAYARWMTSPENPRFTKVVANRLWKRAFGVALIEPLDELLDSSVAMVPELMTHLEKLMVELNYDMRAFQSVIYNTKAYQSEVTREEYALGTVYHFTGPLLRRMTAEQMWDSFVTLINPDPEMENAVAREKAEQRLLSAKKMRDALDSLTGEQLFEGAREAAKAYKARAERTVELQSQIAQARAAEDKDKAKELGRKLNDLQKEMRKELDKHIVAPAMQTLAAKVGAKPVSYTPGKGGSADEAEGSMMMASMTSSGDAAKMKIPGYDKPELTKEERAAAEKALQAEWTKEAQYYGIPEKELKYYFQARSSQIKNWLRAAEIDSPAPRGHYLREFGQSDRETIENANNEASVPQALAMMNGQLLPQILNKYSQLMLNVAKAKYPDDQVEATYMSVLTRKPTQHERDVWAAASESGLNEMDDLIYALLNTQQFIFVQ